jgi:hypothetical protein
LIVLTLELVLLAPDCCTETLAPPWLRPDSCTCCALGL